MERRSLSDTILLGVQKGLIALAENRVKYLHQDKEYDLSPEERVRAAVYVELVVDYRYLATRIDFEVSVPSRSSPKADVVVYEDDKKLSNYIVVETKREGIPETKFGDAVEQGFGYANSLRTKYLIVDSYSKRIVYNVTDYPPNERTKNKIPDIPKSYGIATPTECHEPESSRNLVKSFPICVEQDVVPGIIKVRRGLIFKWEVVDIKLLWIPLYIFKMTASKINNGWFTKSIVTHEFWNIYEMIGGRFLMRSEQQEMSSLTLEEVKPEYIIKPIVQPDELLNNITKRIRKENYERFYFDSDEIVFHPFYVAHLRRGEREKIMPASFSPGGIVVIPSLADSLLEEVLTENLNSLREYFPLES